MNIVLVTHRYPNPDRPDLISDVDALHNMARQWVIAGHRVQVVQLYQHENRDGKRNKPPLYGYRTQAATLDGVAVMRVECRYIRRLPALGRLFFAHLAKRVLPALGLRPDVVVAHFPMALNGFADRLVPGCPRVAVLHTTDIAKIRSRGGIRRFRRLSSEYCALGFRSMKIRRDFHALVSWSGPEFMGYSGAPALPEGGADRQDDGVVKIIYAGKLIARKQADLLLRALHKLSGRIKWRLTIAGDGPEREKLEKLIRDLSLSDRVTMTGQLPRDEVLRQMRAHDVFAMVSYGETFGLVYLEAMACGLIPIGTIDEGIDGVIVSGENGFLVNRDDEAGLTQLIERIYDMNPAERRAMAERGEAIARGMTEQKVAADYIEAVKKAIEK